MKHVIEAETDGEADADAVDGSGMVEMAASGDF